MPTRFDPDMISMLRCPVTKSRLKYAEPELVEKINGGIDSGSIVNQIGQIVTERIEEGLINDDDSLLLPIRGGIVILVTDQAIPLNSAVDR